MSNIKKSSALLILTIIVLFSSVSCGETVPKAEYDSLVEKLAKNESQLVTLQGRLSDAEIIEAKYQELSAKFEELKKQNDVTPGEMESMETQYEELSAKYKDLMRQNEENINEIASLEGQYEELKKDYDALAGQTEEITLEINENNIEQALFDLINQERKDNGLNELIWGENMDTWSEENSRNMAATKQYLQYTNYLVPYQQVFWAAGYSSVERVVNGALITWKSNSLQYDNNVLNHNAIYGAIGVYKSGDIFYITFLASNFP